MDELFDLRIRSFWPLFQEMYNRNTFSSLRSFESKIKNQFGVENL